MDDILNDEQDCEELYGKWEPKLYQAAMADTDRHFAALVGGPRWDDPYTIILMRDAVKQTFSRSDVRRELRDIRVIPSLKDDAEPSYVTISLQGDIYVVGPDGSQHFIIPGTQARIRDRVRNRFPLHSSLRQSLACGRQRQFLEARKRRQLGGRVAVAYN
ncbi:hypothetical protein [Agrobacterium radiobacter]|uniref:hypothetical protein n=1 Tax=Agrobacterium radiobacter TaxID=362 RepID=UPI003CE47089